MAAMPDPNPTPLPYAPPPPILRRKSTRRFVLRIVICALLAISALQMPALWQRTQLLRLQSQCMKYSPPPTQVVYEYGRSPDAVTSVSSPQWNAYSSMTHTTNNGKDALLFLHARRSPSGQRRLLAITARPVAGYPLANAACTISVVHPATAWRNADLVASNWISDPLWRVGDRRFIRFYAGQADPNDPTHFTLAFETDRHKGLLDGWLRDDESVLLQVRKP